MRPEAVYARIVGEDGVTSLEIFGRDWYTQEPRCREVLDDLISRGCVRQGPDGRYYEGPRTLDGSPADRPESPPAAPEHAPIVAATPAAAPVSASDARAGGAHPALEALLQCVPAPGSAWPDKPRFLIAFGAVLDYVYPDEAQDG